MKRKKKFDPGVARFFNPWKSPKGDTIFSLGTASPKTRAHKEERKRGVLFYNPMQRASLNIKGKPKGVPFVGVMKEVKKPIF